jgi:hypothetical protein
VARASRSSHTAIFSRLSVFIVAFGFLFTAAV